MPRLSLVLRMGLVLIVDARSDAGLGDQMILTDDVPALGPAAAASQNVRDNNSAWQPLLQLS